MTTVKSNNPQNCINANLRKATRAVTNLYAQEMHETELHRTQFTLLSTISGYKECTVTELAAHMAMDQTTVTRSVDKLRKAGYVEAIAGEDRRTRILRLTDSGREKVETAYPAWQRAQRQVWEALGPEKSQQLLTLLNEVTELAK